MFVTSNSSPYLKEIRKFVLGFRTIMAEQESQFIRATNFLFRQIEPLLAPDNLKAIRSSDIKTIIKERDQRILLPLLLKLSHLPLEDFSKFSELLHIFCCEGLGPDAVHNSFTHTVLKCSRVMVMAKWYNRLEIGHLPPDEWYDFKYIDSIVSVGPILLKTCHIPTILSKLQHSLKQGIEELNPRERRQVKALIVENYPDYATRMCSLIKLIIVLIGSLFVLFYLLGDPNTKRRLT